MADAAPLPDGVTWTQDAESVEITVAVADGCVRDDLRVKTTKDTVAVHAKVCSTLQPILVGSLRHDVEHESCCWALETRRKGGKTLTIQLEKKEEGKEWDALLRASASGSILEELGRAQVVADAGASTSTSVACGRCGALVKSSRWEAHATLWCEALASDDNNETSSGQTEQVIHPFDASPVLEQELSLLQQVATEAPAGRRNVTERAASMASFSVGCWVLVDGKRAAEIACANDDGSWDVIYDDGEDEDAVPPSRLELRDAQRERPRGDTDSALVEAAAASLRLSLTHGPAGESDEAAAARHMAMVVDKLWLGDKAAAARLEWLQRHNITAVVNVTRREPNYFEHEPGFAYFNVRCEDQKEDAAALEAATPDALAQLARWMSEGRHVLVHCHAGRSRSATLVLAHLMRERAMPLEAAIELVSQRRAILPNPGFFDALVRMQSAWLPDKPKPPPGFRSDLTRMFVRALNESADKQVEAARASGAKGLDAYLEAAQRERAREPAREPSPQPNSELTSGRRRPAGPSQRSDETRGRGRV